MPIPVEAPAAELSTPRSDAATRYVAIDGIRACAAIYVVLFHIVRMAALTSGGRWHAEWFAWAVLPLSTGHLAVAAFIVLSGFCLSLSAFRRGSAPVRSVAGFYARRLGRILPAYYACLALSLAVALTITAGQRGQPFSLYVPVTTGDLVSHLALVHNLSPHWMYKINGVLWFVGLELQLCLLHPALVLLVHRLGRVALLLVASGVSVLAMAGVPAAGGLYVWYVLLFAMGIATAHLALVDPGRIGPGAASRVGAGAVLAALASLALCGVWAVQDTIAAVAVCCALYLIVRQPSGLVSRAFSAPALVSLGVFSYSIYLLHHPVLQVLYVLRPAAVQTADAKLVYLIATLPIVLAVCYLFYRLFERPFLVRRARSA